MIINEYEYVKGIMERHEKPKDISIKKLISYIAKYYYSDHINDKLMKYKQFVFSKLNEFNLDSSYYRESLYDNYVNLICKKILKGQVNSTLFNPKEIQISKKEFDIIRSVPSERHQKLLFTMYVLAKTRLNSNGWVNYSLKEIFQCANINIKRDDKILMINDLKEWGYITTSLSYKRTGFKVEYYEVDEENSIEKVITNFSNIGNQYIVMIRDGWKMCECCGRLIKIKGNATKYCNKCLQERQLEQDRIYQDKVYHNDTK